jgi:hypothetical protein
VAISSELVRVRDIFGKQRLIEGRYLPGEIDRRWEAHIEQDFRGLLAESAESLPVPLETITSYLERQERKEIDV